MSLVRWLAGSVSVASFRERVLGIQAYAGLGLAVDACRLFDWSVLARLPVREGRAELVGAGKVAAYTGALDIDSVRATLAAGNGIRVRDADALDPEIGELADDFSRELHGCASVHLSATPRRARGGGWRRQGADSFFAQTAGSEEHQFRPQPIPGGGERSGHGGPGAHTCVLEAGDWLYVPRGWWHRTEAVDDSLALTIELARPWTLPVARPLHAPGVGPRPVAPWPVWRSTSRRTNDAEVSTVTRSPSREGGALADPVDPGSTEAAPRFSAPGSGETPVRLLYLCIPRRE